MSIRYKTLSNEPVVYVMKDKYECQGIRKKGVGSKMYFNKGAKVTGYPSIYQIANARQGNNKGLIIHGDKEYYIIPDKFLIQQDYLNANGDEIIQSIKTDVSDIGHATQQAIEESYEEAKKVNPKEIFGFSWKQLAVIGIIGIVMIKIMK